MAGSKSAFSCTFIRRPDVSFSVHFRICCPFIVRLYFHCMMGLVSSHCLVLSWPTPAPPRHRKTNGHSVRIFLIVFSSICGYVFVKDHIVMNIYKSREAYTTYNKIFSSSDQMFDLGLIN